MDTPTEESLRQMSFSELKRCAKKSGIKGNKKASLIASILESAHPAEDSFVAMEQKIINSCKKNKLEKFDKDKEVGSDSPRRETYIIDSPLDVSLALNNDLVTSSASPALKKTPVEQDSSMNVTLTRGSEKKSKKRKVSFVTPIRRSARLSVLTPHFASVKDRPKTPIPSRISSGRKRESPMAKEKKLFSGSLYITNSSRKSSEGGKDRRPSTPMPNHKPKRMKLDSTGHLETPTVTPVSTPVASTAQLSKQKQPPKFTPVPTIKSALTPALLSSTRVKRSSPRNSALKRVVPLTNPRSKTSSTPMSSIKKAVTPSVKAQTATPKSQVKLTTPMQPLSARAKKTTPNFNKLHQKEFDKMESIDEYARRKKLNSAKKVNEQQKFRNPSKPDSSKMAIKKNSRIPKKFNGIPFIPTITSTLNIKTDFGFSAPKPTLTPGKRLPAVKFGSHNESSLSKKFVKSLPKPSKPVLKENSLLQKKFDLKASLSKKLKYKPHTGPLKPLGQVNLNSSVFSNTCPPQKAVVKAKRIEARGVLRGVRKNRRFELQMKNRQTAKA